MTTADELSDGDVVERVLAGEQALFELLMRRHNQRVFRTARAIVKDDHEVEDVMQQAYMNAFTHLGQFERRAQFSTWLIRITVNEALARRRRMQAATHASADISGTDENMDMVSTPQADPERQAYASELRRVIEAAVDTLPDTYRAVFVLREIEGLTTTETGEGLGLGEEAVKTRLHRARAMMRRAVAAQIDVGASGAFQFLGPRCDRVVAAVLDRLGIAPERRLTSPRGERRSTTSGV
jgi:RNA polymerase sigma-70 factor (ECF subfamily)